MVYNNYAVREDCRSRIIAVYGKHTLTLLSTNAIDLLISLLYQGIVQRHFFLIFFLPICAYL